MITEQELLDAIDEFNRKPATITTMSALSYLYCVYDHLYGDTVSRKEYSRPRYYGTSDSEFMEIIDGKRIDDVLQVVDELAESVKLLHGKLYQSFIGKLREL